MINDILLYVEVIEAGSLKLASEKLNIPSSTVSRRLQSLEEKLKCKLLNRNSHSFEMTKEGRNLYDKTHFHLSSVSSIISEIKNDIAGDKGPVKVLAPINLMTSTLHKYFSEYLKLNPDIQLELELSNIITPFDASDADFAIRVGKQKDSDLTQFKLGKIETVLVASPCYAESIGEIEQPKDLEGKDFIVCGSFSKWKLFQHLDSINQFTFIPDSRRLLVNDLQVAKQFAVNGLGIAMLPMTEIKKELINHKLVKLLPSWQGEVRDVYIIWYRRHLLSIRASKLIDFLKKNVVFTQ